MFDHVTLPVSDREQSTRFYTAVLKTIGVKLMFDQDQLSAFKTDCFSFWLRDAERGSPRGAHLAFAADTRKQVDAFYKASIAAGATSAGCPRLQPYRPGYYAAYLLDPDGNNIEIVAGNT